MIIDACVGIIFLFFALAGYLTGALKQIIRLAALIGGYFISLAIAPAVASLIREKTGFGVDVADVLIRVLCWALVYVILSWIGGMIVKGIHSASEALTSLDRAVGAVVGMAKAGVILIVAVYLFGMVKDIVYQRHPEALATVQESFIMRHLGETDAVDRILPDELLRLRQLAAAAGDEKRAQALAEDPAIRALMENPRFQKAMKDEDLRRLAEDKDIWGLMRHPKFQELLKDPNVLRLLEPVGGKPAENPEKRIGVEAPDR
ncbi:MAG: CvpA family protein [Myxococcales bacterium]|nr:MAG: CvpA family protein [Myxococcales bacterium]